MTRGRFCVLKRTGRVPLFDEGLVVGNLRDAYRDFDFRVPCIHALMTHARTHARTLARTHARTLARSLARTNHRELPTPAPIDLETTSLLIAF